MIDRKKLISRHNPKLQRINKQSPLTVGNGDFAFTADVTGLQTLSDVYSDFPLCTMSTWGWHTEPASDGGYYAYDELALTEYDIGGRNYKYAVHPQPGNEAVYHWLRHNPHRLNLGHISLLWDGVVPPAKSIKSIKQELDLYAGVLTSRFTLCGHKMRVQTVCAQTSDTLGFSIDADEDAWEHLSIGISFPYGSPDKDASDWYAENKHTTVVKMADSITASTAVSAAGNMQDSMGHTIEFIRKLDKEKYVVLLNGADTYFRTIKHLYVIKSSSFTLAFAKSKPQEDWSFERVSADSTEWWQRFWEEGGAADFSKSKDLRAHELERRIILSQYLTATQCSGSMPPQETGLSCNSWYGKFHLEMHIIHAGWFPLWGHSRLLERSLPWYESILETACENAAQNGYLGARWPKMTGPEGMNSPSWIATLLIWQQPHILYMLELVRCAKDENEQLEFMREHWELVEQTARFMCSFLCLNETTGLYELTTPVIPAQEEHTPEDTLNPGFELAYWRFGLEIAVSWALELGEDYGEWKEIAGKIIEPPQHGGLYIAHQKCYDTFTRFNKDHPSMLYAFGFIHCESIDVAAMSRTVDKVRECWDRDSMWGWDFAFIAMTLARLGRYEEAIDILLADNDKNYCAPNGNYYQRGRDDLPLYLPGNGSLLFAMAMLLAGYGNSGACLPDNGLWDVEVEGIKPLPR